MSGCPVNDQQGSSDAAEAARKDIPAGGKALSFTKTSWVGRDQRKGTAQGDSGDLDVL